MYNNMNVITSAPNILVILTLLLIAAVIGYILHWLLSRSKYASLLSKLETQNQDLSSRMTQLGNNISELDKKILSEKVRNNRQDESLSSLENGLQSRSQNKAAPAPVKESVVELDKRGVPKGKITHLLSIKDVQADSKTKDDLKIIKGVGPFIEEKLNAIGLFTFKQISLLNDNDCEIITNAIKFFPGRIKRDNWIGQAAKLMK